MGTPTGFERTVRSPSPELGRNSVIVPHLPKVVKISTGAIIVATMQTSAFAIDSDMVVLDMWIKINATSAASGTLDVGLDPGGGATKDADGFIDGLDISDNASTTLQVPKVGPNGTYGVLLTTTTEDTSVGTNDTSTSYQKVVYSMPTGSSRIVYTASTAASGMTATNLDIYLLYVDALTDPQA